MRSPGLASWRACSWPARNSACCWRFWRMRSPSLVAPSAMALTGELREERRRQKEAEAQAVFEDARKRAQAAGVALETVYVPERLPDEAILETADRCGADLVVMAAHGHRGRRKLRLGSQTQAVVSRGHLPVLVVR
mgnify:CR=1 FL=1